jgi:hypothetical protein
MTELRDVIRRHKVVYEVHPALSVFTGQRTTVGYDVELRGTHETQAGWVTAGCDACRAVWDDLRRVAEAVVPHEMRPAEYDVPAFDHSLHEVQGREDVQLIIEIRHREDYNRPLDECEERCVHEIVANLRAIGAQENQWSDSRAAGFASELRDHAKDSSPVAKNEDPGRHGP